ncbi:unnamed protein product [Polarella glacialis]|uniref:Uncharacterized protein n=1 Tax=Polarella glacialis TaxID=89957 RepID=A0A813JN84_POLGL|nr:unnamed protein product [Polarella glacialis]CAE8681141.1 unnamed protein product [Polarella glacialis]
MRSCWSHDQLRALSPVGPRVQQGAIPLGPRLVPVPVVASGHYPSGLIWVSQKDSAAATLSSPSSAGGRLLPHSPLRGSPTASSGSGPQLAVAAAPSFSLSSSTPRSSRSQPQLLLPGTAMTALTAQPLSPAALQPPLTAACSTVGRGTWPPSASFPPPSGAAPAEAQSLAWAVRSVAGLSASCPARNVGNVDGTREASQRSLQRSLLQRIHDVQQEISQLHQRQKDGPAPDPREQQQVPSASRRSASQSLSPAPNARCLEGRPRPRPNGNGNGNAAAAAVAVAVAVAACQDRVSRPSSPPANASLSMAAAASLRLLPHSEPASVSARVSSRLPTDSSNARRAVHQGSKAHPASATSCAQGSPRGRNRRSSSEGRWDGASGSLHNSPQAAAASRLQRFWRARRSAAAKLRPRPRESGRCAASALSGRRPGSSVHSEQLQPVPTRASVSRSMPHREYQSEPVTLRGGRLMSVHFAAARIQRAWRSSRMELWRSRFVEVSLHLGWLGRLDWLRSVGFLYGNELADHEDVRSWHEQRAVAPLDREVDPWGCLRLKEHLHRAWYPGEDVARSSSRTAVKEDKSPKLQRVRSSRTSGGSAATSSSSVPPTRRHTSQKMQQASSAGTIPSARHVSSTTGRSPSHAHVTQRAARASVPPPAVQQGAGAQHGNRLLGNCSSQSLASRSASTLRQPSSSMGTEKPTSRILGRSGSLAAPTVSRR